jgi:hypothetical protein
MNRLFRGDFVDFQYTELSKRKIATPPGGKWHPQTVRQVLARLDAA